MLYGNYDFWQELCEQVPPELNPPRNFDFFHSALLKNFRNKNDADKLKLFIQHLNVRDLEQQRFLTLDRKYKDLKRRAIEIKMEKRIQSTLPPWMYPESTCITTPTPEHNYSPSIQDYDDCPNTVDRRCLFKHALWHYNIWNDECLDLERELRMLWGHVCQVNRLPALVAAPVLKYSYWTSQCDYERAKPSHRILLFANMRRVGYRIELINADLNKKIDKVKEQIIELLSL